MWPKGVRATFAPNSTPGESGLEVRAATELKEAGAYAFRSWEVDPGSRRGRVIRPQLLL